MLKKYLQMLENKPPFKRLDLETSREFFTVSKDKYPCLFSSLDDFTDVHVPLGWRGIVSQLFHVLERYEGAVLLKRVKQKFGDLEIYVDTREAYKTQVDNLVDRAEYLATTICEFCGSEDDVTLFEIGYVSRVCSSCLAILCEYTVINWVLTGKNPVPNYYQTYCLRRLRGERDIGFLFNLEKIHGKIKKGITRHRDE
jgi:hypothetical protein